ncbi:Signal transduction response regulator, receiver domain [Syntrophomonas zehnderi OL-4]|uniref:Stage 0 sporulation protein A homolog n=1 Tax=Syntrophomonas zehnderi OL-4 TaxID=690567 RepID=A0A0E4GDP3_9FIRM|nr:response regulator transcription factor [Syntrophomonas zehnderi]CFX54423.1 Signal transduction response regulator, receiver domain [Syntrophomonas zehnderi OL-4]
MNGKIMVVDDEEALVRLISYNLAKEGFNILTAGDGNEAWQMIIQEKPDLIVLDLMLPGKDGLEICRDLRKENIDIPIIMLTARDEEIDKVLGLELGADDYMTKPFSVRELSARVKAVLRRKQAIMTSESADTELIIGSFIIKPERYEIYFNGELLDLTLKEYELLEVLLKNKGRVLKREYLLQILWDYADGVNTRVLDVHISKIRDKIEIDSKNPRYIKTVRGLGYRFEDNSDV